MKGKGKPVKACKDGGMVKKCADGGKVSKGMGSAKPSTCKFREC